MPQGALSVAAGLVLHNSSTTALSLPAQLTYGRSWDAVWINPGEVVEEGLLVSPRMFTDHLGGTLNEALLVRPHFSPCGFSYRPSDCRP